MRAQILRATKIFERIRYIKTIKTLTTATIEIWNSTFARVVLVVCYNTRSTPHFLHTLCLLCGSVHRQALLQPTESIIQGGKITITLDTSRETCCHPHKVQLTIVVPAIFHPK
jgi:hypothetical protein